MKVKIFTLSLFIFSNYLFCQTLEVEYDYKITKKALEIVKKEHENDNFLKSLIIQAQKDIKNYPMDFLISNDGYSIDFSQSMQVDSEFQKFPISKSLALANVGLDIYTYNTQNTSYTTNNNNKIVSHDLEKLSSWKITKEAKKILGHNCYKAYFYTDIPELKRAALIMPKYAWFTTEIPMQGGPTIFGNLPGLILELETKAAHFIATSIKKTDKEVKKIDLNNEKIMSFVQSERYYIDMTEDKIQN